MTSIDSNPDQIPEPSSPTQARTNRAKRDEILDTFEASGMSAASFARQHDIRYTTFANWVRRRRELKNDDVAAAPPEFAEVVVRRRPDAVASITIGFPGGASTEVCSPGDAVLAAALIREIAGGGSRC